MRVLVLGGTGSIGAAVVDVLINQQHDVFALARSPVAETKLLSAGATPISGDIRKPVTWIDRLEQVDAVVHAACTWGADLNSVDQAVVDALLKGLKTTGPVKALIYTGGCWHYGNTGDDVATENSPLKPTSGFSSSVNTMYQVLSEPGVRGMVIHPAMVYEHQGGVFEGMYDDLDKLGYVRIFGDYNVRWPLVHTVDLAHLYVLMLENGSAGDVFNASAIDGVEVGDIARAISLKAGIDRDPIIYDIEDVKKEFGEWAEGYAIDQQMSGMKAKTDLGWIPEHDDVFRDINS